MQFPSPGRLLITTWRTLAPLPGGKWVFGRILGLLAPYSGSIRPEVLDLRPGYARVRLRERWGVRNHLESVHAIALANLAEVTSGLAMLAALPAGVRGILTALSVSYVKKARGVLVGECSCTCPEVSGPTDHEIEVFVRDQRGDVVVQARARWRLAPQARPQAGAKRPGNGARRRAHVQIV
ncbi:MAG TPA: hotdog fold domain-containing protein [Polyangia bacterium]